MSEQGRNRYIKFKMSKYESLPRIKCALQVSFKALLLMLYISLLTSCSALNNLEYGEAPEYFLPASVEQKIRERAESVVRPGTEVLSLTGVEGS